MNFYYENLKHPSVAIKGENLNFLPHLHREIELIYVEAGELQVTINGVVKLIKKNTLCFIEANSIHSYTTLNSCIYYLIIFDADILLELKGIFEYQTCNNAMFSATDEIIHAIKMLQQIHWSDDIKLIKGYLLILMALTLKQLTFSKKNYEYTNLIETVLQYINVNYTNSINLKTTAQIFHISSEHLSRLFKNKLNINFLDYITMLRIDAAKNLLMTTTDSILQIAVCSGFENERTFHRVFKSKTGMTPKQFRNITHNL